MNPQQFANMGGMGRGMPNMNMGMGMNSNGQNKQPNFLQFIYQSLTQSQQNDGPFTGWRGALSIQERAAQIKILFDSLRMLGSTVDTKRSLDIALAFERKQFMQSSTQDAYKHSIHEKLASIRDQRQQQVTTAANGMPNASGPPNGMMNGFPQMGGANQNMNFPQQQGMQPSSMLPQMQQQASMNVSRTIEIVTWNCPVNSFHIQLRMTPAPLVFLATHLLSESTYCARLLPIFCSDQLTDYSSAYSAPQPTDQSRTCRQ